MPDYNLDSVFAQNCHCNDCEAAVSPLAYFADLLKYTLDVIKGNNSGTLVPIDYDFLGHNFRQSFKKIPFECKELESKICQARFAIETLRKYQNTVDDEQISSYLDATYTALLAVIGLDLNTLRLIQGASTNEKKALATKLGFKFFKTDNIDTFQRLYLYSGGSGIYELNEANMERLFGLVDTTRNPYSSGTKWGDSGAILTRWNFEGINWLINTDSNGYLYIDISGDTTKYYKIYKKKPVGGSFDSTQLVAEGSTSGFYSGIVIDLFEKNHSGLSGHLLVDGSATSTAISFNVIPEVLCWKYYKASDDWNTQDHTYDTLGFPIVDPDVVTINDIRNPYETTDPASTVIQYFLARKQTLQDKRDDISEAFAAIPSDDDYVLASGVTTVDYAHFRFDAHNKLFAVRKETGDDLNNIYVYEYSYPGTGGDAYAYSALGSATNQSSLPNPGPIFPNNGKLYICNDGSSYDTLVVFNYNSSYTSITHDEDFGISSGSTPWRIYDILTTPSDVIAKDNFVWLADSYDSKARITRYQIAASYVNPDLVAIPETTTSITDVYGNKYELTGNIKLEKKDINGTLIWALGKKDEDGEYIAGSGDGEFTHAVSVNLGTDGYIYISDEGDGVDIPARIVKVNTEGKFISKTTKVSDLNEAKDIYSDSLGNIYIANTGEGVVVILDKNGIVKLSIELPDPTTGTRTVEFVSADESGNIYIGDSEQKSIFKYSSDGKMLLEVKGVTGTTTLFSRLDDMFLQFDTDGNAQNLYVLVKTLNGSDQVTAVELVQLNLEGVLVKSTSSSGFTIDSMNRTYVDSNGVIYLSADDTLRRGVPQTDGSYTWTVLSVKYFSGSYTTFTDLTVIKILPKGEKLVMLADIGGTKYVLQGSIQTISSADTFVADFGWGGNYFLEMPNACSMAVTPSREIFIISDTTSAGKYFRFYLPVSAHGGASSQPGKLYLDNEGKNLYFTITSSGTGEGPIYKTKPELPISDLSTLGTFINKDVSYLSVDCDNYIYTIEDGEESKQLVQYNLSDVSQARVISPSDHSYETISVDSNKRLHSKIHTTSWEVNVISVTKGVAETVNIAFEQDFTFADINMLSKFSTQGVDIQPNLRYFGFDKISYAFLQKLNLLSSNGAALLSSEQEQFFDLLTSAYKHKYLYTGWRTNESDNKITLSPLFFNVLNNFEENEIMQVQWRATYKERRAWREILLGRKEFVDGIRDNLTDNVGKIEDAQLPNLRDGLIMLLTGDPFTGKNQSERADILTEELLIDYKDNCCTPTNRISLSIEVLQKFLMGVRHGFITEKEFYISSAWTSKNIVLNDDAFDNSWQLLSSYANWRPAMFVHMYPENLLLPSLRRQQSPAFRKITDGIFSNDRFTPYAGNEMATEYGQFVMDIANLTIQASCIAYKPKAINVPPSNYVNTSRVPNGNNKSVPVGNSLNQFNPNDSAPVSKTLSVYEAGVSRVETLFMFAQSRVTKKVYWTCIDTSLPIELAYKDWSLLVDGTDIVEVIGATSVTLYDNNRHILVILKIKKEGRYKVASISYDLNKQQWDDECTDLDFDNDIDLWKDFEAYFSNPQNSDLQVNLMLRRLPDNVIFAGTISKKGDEFVAKQSFLNLNLILKPLIDYNLATAQQNLTEARDRANKFTPNLGYVYNDLTLAVANVYKLEKKQAEKYNPGQVLAYYRTYSSELKQKINLPEFVKKAYNFDVYGKSTQRLLFINNTSEKIELFEINEVAEGKILFPTRFNIGGASDSAQANFLKNNSFIGYISVFATNELLTFWINRVTRTVSCFCLYKDTGAYLTKKITNFVGFSNVRNMSIAPFTDAYSDVDGEIPIVVNRVNTEGANQVCKGALKLTITSGSVSGVELLNKIDNPVTPLTPFVYDPFEIVPTPMRDKMQDYISKSSEKLLKANANAQGYLKKYIKELYYFMPVSVGWQLQQKGYYTEALDWYRLVYDYTKAVGQRKIYYGLKEEETLANAFTRSSNWLIDPIDPHGIASDRTNSYTRFTVMGIVLCLIQNGDNEFTKDSVETVSHARQLYMEAIDLLNTPGITYSGTYVDQQEQLKRLDEFDNIFVDDVDGKKAVLLPVWTKLKSDCGLVKNLSTLATLVDGIETVMEALSTPDQEQVRTALGSVQVLISNVLTDEETPVDSVNQQNNNNDARNRSHQLVMADDQVTMNIVTMAQTAENAFANNISASSGIKVETLKAGTISLVSGSPVLLNTSFLSAEANFGNLTLDTSATQSELLVPASGAVAPENFNTGFVSQVAYSSTFANTVSLANLVNLADMNRAVSDDLYVYPYSLPGNSFSYCVPRNPVPDMYRMYAEMNLYKLRNCLNIAGIKRELDPFSAPTDSTTGLPYIGVNGQIVFPGSAKFYPSQYRYEVLIERAKQLCALAQQMEVSMFTAMEKYDAEKFSQLQAKQQIKLTKESLKVNKLKIKYAEGEIKLAQLSQNKAQAQVNHYNDLISSGTSSLEYAALGMLQAASAAFITAASFTPAFTPKPLASGHLFSAQGASSISSNIGQAIATQAGFLSQLASFERRKQEWEFGREMGQHDVGIAQQQVRQANTGLRIASQEYQVADMQARNNEETLNFIKDKFTNAALYSWMSQALGNIYNWFLRQATAMAIQAQNQLAFERQENPQGFVKTDYWEAPVDPNEQKAPDRKGLTGSARLLQDIYQLDQYAFQTDVRKLNLTKTFSLANLAPAEFEEFKRTGQIRFSTLGSDFDRDFPGHYLRQVKQVRTSVIALVYPIDGIKATLSSCGRSYIVTKAGVAFQRIPINNKPAESIALTAAQNATGVFEMQAANANNGKLMPFEGMGVETTWNFTLPKASNAFDFSTIADVQITIDYTAMDSFEYRQQVLKEMGTEFKNARGYSLRFDFPDQWYDVNNTAGSCTITLPFRKEDFPVNLVETPVISAISFYFSCDDISRSFEISQFTFRAFGNGTQEISGVGGVSVNRMLSSRQGAGDWGALISKSVSGNLELTIADTSAFLTNRVQDVLIMISYRGELPPYPSSI